MQARSASNLKGIDVSRYQDDIDWKKVANTGIAFAIAKASQGTSWVDPQFRRNAVGAPAVGLKVGFYHFAEPKNNPISEAEHFADTVKGLPVDLPYVLDIEQTDGKSAADVCAWCLKWLAEVKRLTGKPVMVYTGAAFAKSTLTNKDLAQYPLWVAHYGTEDPMDNGTWAKWAIFQYSSSGKVDGITGNVDMNVMEADFLAEKLTKFEDVAAGHWAESAIRAVSDAGIMAGMPDGKFEPSRPVTRAELAAVVAKLLNK